MAITEHTVTIGDKDYKIMMSRSAVRRAEQNGLDVQKLDSQPITQMTNLMAAALYGGGARLGNDKMEALVDQWFDEVDDLEELMTLLAGMYAEVFPTRE